MATRQIPYTVEDGKGNVVEQGTYTVTTTPEQDNQDAIRAAAAQALASNRQYVGLSSPTAAQTAAQVKALTRQQNGLIRLLLGQLDNTD